MHGNRISSLAMSLQWSWRELEQLAAWIRPEIEGAFVEKVFIPKREGHPDGYLKNELAILFSRRERLVTFLFSIRPQEVYLDLHTQERVKPSPDASHSGFDLFLHKTDRIERALLDDIARLLGLDPIRATTSVLKKWAFARSPAPLDRPLLDDEARIGVGGDWTSGGRVEGAFLSGLALAGRVLGLPERA